MKALVTFLPSFELEATAPDCSIVITFGQARDGDQGKSAYQAAVEGGFTGTEEEFNRELAKITGFQDQIDQKVSKSGDTMSGPLTLNAAPALDMQAANRGWVLDKIAAKESGALSFKGFIQIDEPAGDIRPGNYWLSADALPTEFPVTVCQWNGTDWTTQLEYTPSAFDLWDLSGNAYYYFGNTWNQVNFAGSTFNSNQFEVVNGMVNIKAGGISDNEVADNAAIASHKIVEADPIFGTWKNGSTLVAGQGSTLTNPDSGGIVFGYNAKGNGTSVVLGRNAQTGSSTGISIGPNSSGSGVSVGNTAVSGSGGISIGTGSQSGTSGIGVGQNAKGTGTRAYQIGNGTNSTDDTLQVGNYPLLDLTTGKIPSERISESDPIFTVWKNATGLGAGNNSSATGTGIALGQNVVSANNGTAVGVNSKAAASSVAIGNSADGSGIQGIAIGVSANVRDGGIAIGQRASANANTIAIGSQATTSTNVGNSIQLGAGTNANANWFQVTAYQLLDLLTGLIPNSRLSTAIARAADTVNLTGGQSITGVKTFASSPIVPTPTTITQASNKEYVDKVVKRGIYGPTIGILIQTSIPTSGSATAILKLIGNPYNNGTSRIPIDSTFIVHNYNSKFHAGNGLNFGWAIPQITVLSYNGFMCFWIETPAENPVPTYMYIVEVYQLGNSIRYNTVTSITNEAVPADGVAYQDTYTLVNIAKKSDLTAANAIMTGYILTPTGSVVATDSALAAIAKLENRIKVLEAK